MYNEFYGFREPPFNITPDPRFLFFSDKHREAFNHVLFGIRERKGFIQITGEVGRRQDDAVPRRPGRSSGRALHDGADPESDAHGHAAPARPSWSSSASSRASSTATAYLDILNAFLLEQAARGQRRRAHHRRGAGPRAGAARAGAPALEPRDRPPQAPADRPHRAAGAARKARQTRSAAAAPAHHRAVSPDAARPLGDRALHSPPPARRGRRRTADLHAVGHPAGLPLRARRPAPDQRRVRQGAALYGYVNGTYELKARAVSRAIRELEGEAA